MDVKAFADELLRALAETGLFERVALHTEGPIVDGHAHVREEFFLRFYFNEVTGTIAFALIERHQRIWGIDYDNRRGWHLHPVDTPTDHVGIRSAVRVGYCCTSSERVVAPGSLDLMTFRLFELTKRSGGCTVLRGYDTISSSIFFFDGPRETQMTITGLR